MPTYSLAWLSKETLFKVKNLFKTNKSFKKLFEDWYLKKYNKKFDWNTVRLKSKEE